MASSTMMMPQQTITIPINSNAPLPYLFEANREDYIKLVVPLYEASITGDWETAKLIFHERPDLIRCGLSENLVTALHVAVASKLRMTDWKFVKNLVNMMTKEELELKNKHSNTAFWIAASVGNTPALEIMMKKNSSLLNIRGYKELLPLSVSALNLNRLESWSVEYLYDSSQKMTGDHWTDGDRDLTLLNCVKSEIYDVALQILEDRPNLAQNVSVLELLAQDPESFERGKRNLITRIIVATVRCFLMKEHPGAEEDTDAMKILKIIWEHATRTMSLDEIESMLRGPPTTLDNGTIQYSSRLLFVAAESGNTKFIVELLRTFPDLVLNKNDDGHTIFHIAVKHRHRGVYNLLNEIDCSSANDICLLNDIAGNNMIHLVGKSSKKMRTKPSTASLLMQREILWFLEVSVMMPSYLMDQKNNDGQTPYELFSKENEDLVSKGLEWMKDCMVVATLIITVAFAVAFTVPGGYNQEHGLPIFIHHHTFLIFAIADVVSLFSSSTSLLVFLSILTARNNQIDFFSSLPLKLMVGLLTLFISVVALMVTFRASFFVLYHKELKLVPILIAVFATLPVFVFAVLQFHVWLDMFRSTFDRHYLFRPKKRTLYTTKPRLGSDNSPCWWFPHKSITTRIFFKKC